MRALFLKHMNSLSRYETERKKNSNDFWGDEVEEGFHDNDPLISSDAKHILSNKVVNPYSPGPYRPPH